MKAPQLEPHKEHAAAFQRVFENWHLAAKLRPFLKPLPRSRGRPRKSNWEKEQTEVVRHIEILRDAALVEATWQRICEVEGRPHKNLPAKEIASVLKNQADYRKAELPRIRNRLSAARRWAEAHEQTSNYHAHLQRIKNRLTI
jgi:hypothetical protein